MERGEIVREELDRRDVTVVEGTEIGKRVACVRIRVQQNEFTTRTVVRIH